MEEDGTLSAQHNTAEVILRDPDLFCCAGSPISLKKYVFPHTAQHT